MSCINQSHNCFLILSASIHTRNTQPDNNWRGQFDSDMSSFRRPFTCGVLDHTWWSACYEKCFDAYKRYKESYWRIQMWGHWWLWEYFTDNKCWCGMWVYICCIKVSQHMLKHMQRFLLKDIKSLSPLYHEKEFD